MKANKDILRLMADVQETPPPLNTPILVTDGKEFTTCILQEDKTMKKVYMHGHGFNGWEYEFNFEADDITHWLSLFEVIDHEI